MSIKLLVGNMPNFLRLVLVIAFATSSACSSTPKPRPLTAAEFEARFNRDCEIVTSIEAMHHFSAYSVSGAIEAELTSAYISIEQMASWLVACGRDPKSVSQLME